MDDADALGPAERFALTCELFEAGLELMLQNLRRQNPQASEAEIAAALSRWLRTRPGAEIGDTVGRARSVPGRG